MVDFCCKIPDRTNIILDTSSSDPLPEIQKSLDDLYLVGCKIIIMPCNTAYYFVSKLIIPRSMLLVDMIQETKHYIKNLKDYKKILILGTTGTLEGRVFSSVFGNEGIRYKESVIAYRKKKIKNY